MASRHQNLERALGAMMWSNWAWILALVLLTTGDERRVKRLLWPASLMAFFAPHAHLAGLRTTESVSVDGLETGSGQFAGDAPGPDIPHQDSLARVAA